VIVEGTFCLLVFSVCCCKIRDLVYIDLNYFSSPVKAAGLAGRADASASRIWGKCFCLSEPLFIPICNAGIRCDLLIFLSLMSVTGAIIIFLLFYILFIRGLINLGYPLNLPPGSARMAEDRTLFYCQKTELQASQVSDSTGNLNLHSGHSSWGSSWLLA
jgi:hypothetical protein